MNLFEVHNYVGTFDFGVLHKFDVRYLIIKKTDIVKT